MLALTENGYQGQICSFDFQNYELPKNENLFTNNNQYIQRIGIYAPPRSRFLITQNTGEVTIQIGQNFMYEAYDTYITGIQYLGYNNEYKINEELEYTIPATRDKRIVIDFIVKNK